MDIFIRLTDPAITLVPIRVEKQDTILVVKQKVQVVAHIDYEFELSFLGNILSPFISTDHDTAETSTTSSCTGNREK